MKHLLPSKLGNNGVVEFVERYKQWLNDSESNITFSAFCKEYGINNPYAFKDYLFRHFTGLNNTVDFAYLFWEAEKIREDKLIELGLFNNDVNVSFLTPLMRAKFGWSDNTTVVGISMEEIMRAKEQALNK